MKYGKFIYKVVVFNRRNRWRQTLETLANWRTANDHAEKWNLEHGYGRFDSRDFGTGERYATVVEEELHV